MTDVHSLAAFIQQTKRFIAARSTLIQIVTFEEERAERVAAEIAAGLFARPVPIARWTCTEGLTGPDGAVPETRDPIAALDHVIGTG